MFKHILGIRVAVAGLGFIGVIAVLDFLFGDAVLIRAYNSIFDRAPVAQKAPHVVAEVVPNKPEEAPIDLMPVQRRTGSLFTRLCAAQRMSVTFEYQAGDASRFRRRAGTTIVAVPVCYEHNETFKTSVDGESAWDRNGIVAGNRIEFQYQYFDQVGAVDCRVVASEKARRIEGSIACEGGSDAMESRTVTVEIG